MVTSNKNLVKKNHGTLLQGVELIRLLMNWCSAAFENKCCLILNHPQSSFHWRKT